MENRKIDKLLNNYYQNIYDEDNRLIKDKVHSLEFITTTKYIDKYLKDNDKILEIGAGTGRYSLYYASKGYQVDALELVDRNIDIMRSKITNSMNIRVMQGNAIDLSMYLDNTFDVTLLLGPMYHLFKPEEMMMAIDEALRVTKKGGYIYIAFILFDLTMLTWGFMDKNIYHNIGDNKQVSNEFKPNNNEELLFNMMYYKDIRKIIKDKGVKEIGYVATDGIGRLMKDEINEMNDQEYELYVKYHLSICEREDLIGYSGHILAILEK